MKVTFYCDNGANIHSCRKATFDTVNDLGLEEGEWETLSDSEKFQLANEWANDKIDIGWIE